MENHTVTTDNIETLPEVRTVTAEIASLETYAATYAVRNPEEYEAGANDLKRVKAAQKKLEDTRKSLTTPINESLRRLNDFFRGPADRLAGIERIIKSKLVTYSDEQERIRREEQRKAEEAARREREKIEAQAREAERKAREKAEADRRAAEEAAAAGRAEEAARLAARADATEAKAVERVEQLADRAAAVVAPIIEREPPKVAGVATREVPKFEIMDASLIPREYLIVDESKIRKVVQALKMDAKIPGVRVWMERSLAAQSK